MKAIQTLILLFLFPVLLSNTSKTNDHEYYVSVTQIEYSKEQSSLQIITQIFINDFERLLKERYDDTIVLDTEDEPTKVETYMRDYLSEKLKFKVNGNDVNFKFIGKEYEDDITYCYLEIEDVTEVKSIGVINRVLFDVFPEQQNIIRMKLKSKNKSFLLIPDDDSCMLKFE